MQLAAAVLDAHNIPTSDAPFALLKVLKRWILLAHVVMQAQNSRSEASGSSCRWFDHSGTCRLSA